MLLTHKLNAVASVLTKTDQIITGNHRLQVVPVNRNMSRALGLRQMLDAIAWTDGETIFFNEEKIHDEATGKATSKALDTNLMSNLIGVNYHEVSHVMFTPFDVYSSLATNCRDHIDSWCLNALEDQRIERLFVSRYPVAGKLFTSMFLRHVMKLRSSKTYKQTNDGLLIVLAIGRSYLPEGLINSLRASAKPGLDLGKVEDVVERYKRLVLTHDNIHEAQAIVRELRELISPYGRDVDADANQMVASEESGHLDAHSRRSPDKTKDQEQAQSEADKAEQESKDQGNQQSDASESDDSGDTDTSDDAGDGSGAGEVTQSSRLDYYEMTEALYQYQDEAMSDADLTKEVNETFESVRSTITKGTGKGEVKVSGGLKQVSMGSLEVLGKVKRKLGDLRVQSEGVWVPDKKGRPNIGRIMSADAIGNYLTDPMDSYFDIEDATKVNLAVALDSSYSMSELEVELSEAAWLFKRSVDLVGGSSIVYTFNTTTQVVYDSSERAAQGKYKVVTPQGGTMPADALQRCLNWLVTRGGNAIRILVVVTDGDWEQKEESHRIIKAMNGMNVTTVLYGLDEAVSNYGSHQCKVHSDIETLDDAVKLTKELVANAISNVIYQAG